jgi:hypothetical protein
MMFAGVVGFWLSVFKSSVGLLVEEFLYGTLTVLAHMIRPLLIFWKRIIHAHMVQIGLCCLCLWCVVVFVCAYAGSNRISLHNLSAADNNHVQVRQHSLICTYMFVDICF